jgi:hypothetical protein
MNAARDGLQDQATWTFSDVVDDVARENEFVGKSGEDEWIDPEGDDDTGGTEIADQMAEAFGDADVQRAIAEAAGEIRDFYGEQAKYGGVAEVTASAAPRGTKAVADADAPERGWVLPAGMEVAACGGGLAADIAAPSDVRAAGVLRTMLTSADDRIHSANGILPGDVYARKRGRCRPSSPRSVRAPPVHWRVTISAARPSRARRQPRGVSSAMRLTGWSLIRESTSAR